MLELKEAGLYCSQAGIYIDPWRPVEKAVITHAHADHSRPGHKHYLAHHLSEGVMKHRLGESISFQGLNYGEKLHLNGVEISLHPAGHIPGSAQVRLAYQGEIWVVSGDYKLEVDGLSTPFEPVKCHTFITECTFGLPVFRWQKQDLVLNEINDWWKVNAAQGFNSVLFAYALGKGQRIIHGLDRNLGDIWLHGAIYQSNEALKRSAVPIADFAPVTKEIKRDQIKGAMIIAPPSAMGTPWLRRFSPFRTGLVSGWMSIRGNRRRRSIDRGFVMSDHADWYGLNEAIRATEANTIWATHGYTAPFVKWLQDQGYEAHELNTEFQGELAEMQQESDEDATPLTI